RAAATALATAGADVIGVNCGAGPVACLDALEAMGRAADGEPARSIMPNAGLPQRLEGRFVYAASPTYFGTVAPRLLAAGAGILGGCCGTTPEHIAEMRAALDALHAAGTTADEAATAADSPPAPADARRGPSLIERASI